MAAGATPTGVAAGGCHTEGVDDVDDAAVSSEIMCVDCGGRCGLLSVPEPDWGFQPGDVVAYRCADCGDRWDLVVPDTEMGGSSGD